MDHQCNLINSYMTGHGLELYILHWGHMFLDTDLCICYLHMLSYDRSLHSLHILVYNPCMGHRNIQGDKHTSQRHSFHDKQH